MNKKLWPELILPAGNEDEVWELFHENSKIGRYEKSLSDHEILERMKEFHESLSYQGYPIIELPRSFVPVKLPVDEAIVSRSSARDMKPGKLKLAELAALLHLAYGVTRENRGSGFPRPFRVIPSAGALYPLEVYFYSAHIEGLAAGLYHFNPTKHHLRLLRGGDETKRISMGLVQPDVAFCSSLILFITVVFERTVFKYGSRGYRFALLEAGHLAQNLNLVAISLGLACLNIGGYFDRDVDEFLEIDGITHSTIYIAAIGAKAGREHFPAH